MAYELIGGQVVACSAMKDAAYDFAQKMTAIPIAPIANSFMPSYSGRAKGGLNANLQIKGDGEDLKNTLQGQINASCTNAQIQLAGKNLRRILERVSGVLRVPELRTAPVTAFDADIGLGSGKIQVKKLDILSDAFTAQTSGAVPLPDVLTNS